MLEIAKTTFTTEIHVSALPSEYEEAKELLYERGWKHTSSFSGHAYYHNNKRYTCACNFKKTFDSVKEMEKELAITQKALDKIEKKWAAFRNFSSLRSNMKQSELEALFEACEYDTRTLEKWDKEIDAFCRGKRPHSEFMEAFLNRKLLNFAKEYAIQCRPANDEEYERD